MLRSQYKKKIFTFENGKTSTYMGYENFLLQLLAKKFPIESINTSIDMLLRNEEVQIFPYVFENQQHKYLADIFVKILNEYRRWYEVKSTWTLNRCGKNLKLGEQNLAKWKAATIALNEPFDVFVFAPRGKILSIMRFFPDNTVSTYLTFDQSVDDTGTTGAEKWEGFQFPNILRNVTYEETGQSPSDIQDDADFIDDEYEINSDLSDDEQSSEEDEQEADTDDSD